MRKRAKKVLQYAIDDFYTIEELGEVFGIYPEDISQDIEKGKLKAVNHGVLYFVSRTNMDKYHEKVRDDSLIEAMKLLFLIAFLLGIIIVFY